MKLHMEEDRLEKEIELKAPRARVWLALTDYREFSQWFCVRMEGPFEVGQKVRGQITYPGYEHLTLEAEITAMEPESYFAYRWHPYAIEPGVDYTREEPTLVEFHLSETKSGTLLKVVESGFARLPEERRGIAFRKNSDGWEEQMENIQKYVAQAK